METGIDATGLDAARITEKMLEIIRSRLDPDPSSYRKKSRTPASPGGRSGRTAIDFGVYGVPETFVISPDGKIAYRHVGPLTEEAIAAKILPLMGTQPSTQPE